MTENLWLQRPNNFICGLYRKKICQHLLYSVDKTCAFRKGAEKNKRKKIPHTYEIQFGPYNFADPISPANTVHNFYFF